MKGKFLFYCLTAVFAVIFLLPALHAETARVGGVTREQARQRMLAVVAKYFDGQGTKERTNRNLQDILTEYFRDSPLLTGPLTREEAHRRMVQIVLDYFDDKMTKQACMARLRNIVNEYFNQPPAPTQSAQSPSVISPPPSSASTAASIGNAPMTREQAHQRMVALVQGYFNGKGTKEQTNQGLINILTEYFNNAPTISGPIDREEAKRRMVQVVLEYFDNKMTKQAAMDRLMSISNDYFNQPATSSPASAGGEAVGGVAPAEPSVTTGGTATETRSTLSGSY